MKRVLQLWGLVAVICLGWNFPVKGQGVSAEVDPFIGTAKGGNTFPGAVRPWGMVSVSPHNAPGSPSGYISGGKIFAGLGHVHLSGTGCADLGSVIVTVSRGDLGVAPDDRRCTIVQEEAKSGYYRVDLREPRVRMESSVTRRAGITRLSAHGASTLNVVINAGESLALTGGGGVRILASNEIEGYNISGGFCGEANRQTVYFVARFNRPSEEAGTWRDSSIIHAPSLAAPDTVLGGWFRFRMTGSSHVVMKVGVSYVSIANARENLAREIPGWDFESVRNDARDDWDAQLERVRVTGGTQDQRVEFYTALYHTLIHPNIINDVNGEYPLMGRTGIGKYVGRNRYTVFSLWDTYRTLHPLLTLLYPERQSEIASTMVDMAREGGWLPKWELGGNETHMMVGDAAVPVLADTYLKGIRDFDIKTAFEAMQKPGRLVPDSAALAARPGYHEYLRYGFIPVDQDTTQAWWTWGPVSTTLEYCLADWSLSRLASALGEGATAQEYARRAQFYRNCFDSTTGFFRPRTRSGQWMSPFDPKATEGSGNWSGSGGPGFVEGDAWQYGWFVPHDTEGLITLYGGEERFRDRLVRCFDENQFTINNEPDIAYPYLFTYLPGEEQRTRDCVRTIMVHEFSVGPAGLPGNDDAGTISAWFVFSALGIYPDCPASGTYRLGIPLFRDIVVELEPRYYAGGRLRILFGGDENVSSVTWNGTILPTASITHAALTAGGVLHFHTPSFKLH